DVTQVERDNLVKDAMRRSERWRMMREEGKSEEAIVKSFEVPTEMSIFTWNGIQDTVMSPRDSILHYKSFLQTGMMSMVPQTGEVKAWVGGINFKHFKYDHVKQG